MLRKIAPVCLAAFGAVFCAPAAHAFTSGYASVSSSYQAPSYSYGYGHAPMYVYQQSVPSYYNIGYGSSFYYDGRARPHSQTQYYYYGYGTNGAIPTYQCADGTLVNRPTDCGRK